MPDVIQTGWPAVHAKLESSPHLQGPAEKWAFLDLIYLAARGNCRIKVNGRIVELHQGELLHSVRFLAVRWSWSRMSTWRYLDKLIRGGLLTGELVRLPAPSQADLFDSWLIGDSEAGEWKTVCNSYSQKGAEPVTGAWDNNRCLYRIVDYDTYRENLAIRGTGAWDKYYYQSSSIASLIGDMNTPVEVISTSRSSVSELAGVELVAACWNSMPGLIRHGRPAIVAMKRKIARAVQVFGVEVVCLAVERYSVWRVNREGKYRAAYNWTLGEFVSRSEGSHIMRLSSDSWEAGCMPFGSESQTEANERAAKRIGYELAARSAGNQDQVLELGPGDREPDQDRPAWLRWGK